MTAQTQERHTRQTQTAEGAVARVEASLARAIDEQHVFTALDPDMIRLQAHHAEDRAKAGVSLSDIDGTRVAIKDNFDVQGQKTTAGCTMFADCPVASADAPAVARLRRAGAILFGRTNMPPLAFSGLGLNDSLGTPSNPIDSDRIPGGSTAGGAAAVAGHLVEAALGSDTSGSVRIPAAFCGLVGFKPTHGTISADGVVPLAQSLDTVGTLSHSTKLCAVLHQVLTGAALPKFCVDLDGLRMAVIEDGAEDRDVRVAAAFEAALDALRAAGVRTAGIRFQAAQTIAPVIARGGFVAVEAHSLHRNLLETPGDALDPFIAARLRAGEDWSAAAYLQAKATRVEATHQAQALFDRFDVAVMPTVSCVAPRFSDIDTEDRRLAINRRVIRDTMLANLLGLCAISLPMTGAGLPVGLMLMARAHDDARLLALAERIEPIVRNL